MRIVVVSIVTAALVAVGVVALARDSGDDDQAVTLNAKPVRMIALPPSVMAACAEFDLPTSCPVRLPYVSGDGHWLINGCRPGREGCGGVSWLQLDLEHIERQADVPPPRWVHVEVLGGDLDRAFRFTYPAAGRDSQTALADGVFQRHRANAVYFGEVTWSGRSGSLVLAPGYPTGGTQGDHLIFRWRDFDGDHAIGLHAWEPLTEAAATLKQMLAT
ncbi:MAG: hypothetical protein WKF41_16380 [Gaiellaceae bacterium]